MNIHATFAKDRAAAVTHKQTLPADRPASQTGRIGVLVSNLGTPDATDYRSVRRYLAEFLSDQRVIELPKWKWYPILYGIVLNTRPQKTGANYETVWNRDKDESPMRTICNAQTDALAAALAGEPRISVEIGMRYGNPSIESAVGKLMAQGCDRIVFFPLYPQYSATTTATANDQLFRALMKLRHQPAVRTVPVYYDEPAYIEALARSVETHLAALVDVVEEADDPGLAPEARLEALVAALLEAYRDALAAAEAQRAERASRARERSYEGKLDTEERIAERDRTWDQRHVERTRSVAEQAEAVQQAEADRASAGRERIEREREVSSDVAQRSALIDERGRGLAEERIRAVEAEKRTREAHEQRMVQQSQENRMQAKERLDNTPKDQPRSFADLNRSKLAQDYPPGVTEESYTEGNKVIIRRVVVQGNRADEYSKVIAKWGTFYFKNGQSITEAIWARETED